MKNKTFRRIILVIQWVLIVYGLVGIAIYYLQDKLLFHPPPLSANYQFEFNHSYKEYSIPLNVKDTISLVRFIPADDTVAKGAVLYFHGNAGNIQDFAGCANEFLSKNYEVWMPDYPGYGKSRGVITEMTLNEMAFQVKRLINKHFPDEKIIIYGRSLGTGIAANLASSMKVMNQLILVTPYYSIPDLYSSYLPIYPMQSMAKYQFPIFNYLDDVNGPVTIFHGTNDKTIPVASSYKLKKNLKEKVRLVIVKGAGHNDIDTTQEYIRTMDELLK